MFGFNFMNKKQVYECLKKVIDPELYVDIVSLGLIYEVEIREKSPRVKVLMTLTSPGCPLAGSFDFMLRDALSEIKDLDVKEDVDIELTFDPPWNQDMMSEEVKAELGFD